MFVKIDPIEKEVTIRFDQREVVYDFGELDEISLAYAITIRKSQGSEFPVVVTPLAMQQFMLLQRNLIYTGITRAKNWSCSSASARRWRCPCGIIGRTTGFQDCSPG